MALKTFPPQTGDCGRHSENPACGPLHIYFPFLKLCRNLAWGPVWGGEETFAWLPIQVGRGGVTCTPTQSLLDFSGVNPVSRTVTQSTRATCTGLH